MLDIENPFLRLRAGALDGRFQFAHAASPRDGRSGWPTRESLTSMSPRAVLERRAKWQASSAMSSLRSRSPGTPDLARPQETRQFGRESACGDLAREVDNVVAITRTSTRSGRWARRAPLPSGAGRAPAFPCKRLGQQVRSPRAKTLAALCLLQCARPIRSRVGGGAFDMSEQLGFQVLRGRDRRMRAAERAARGPHEVDGARRASSHSPLRRRSGPDRESRCSRG